MDNKMSVFNMFADRSWQVRFLNLPCLGLGLRCLDTTHSPGLALTVLVPTLQVTDTNQQVSTTWAHSSSAISSWCYRCITIIHCINTSFISFTVYRLRTCIWLMLLIQSVPDNWPLAVFSQRFRLCKKIMTWSSAGKYYNIMQKPHLHKSINI